MKTNKGFTLIELLVVVLIIGILAAIAVPKYQVAVLKTQFAELQSLAKSIYQAEQVYFLANGKYSIDFAELDIDIQNIRGSSKSIIYFKDNALCTIGSKEYLACTNFDDNGVYNMAYRIDYDGQRACVAYSSNKSSATHQICKNETGRSGPSEGFSSTYYYNN